MLASMSPQQWREHLRFDRIEMDPIDRLTEVVKQLCVLMCSGDVDLDDFEPEKWRKTSEQIVSPDEAAATVKANVPRGR